MTSRKTAVINRIRSTAAFTLAEALIAVIILLLVTSIVAAGVPAAIRAYDNVVTASNAEVLLSTTMSALRNELCTAKDVKPSSSKTALSYYNVAFGTQSEISKAGSGSGEPLGTIMYRRYAPDTIIDDVMTDTTTPKRLISKEASDKDKGLYVTYRTVDYSDGVVTFTDLTVKKKNGSDTPAKRTAYSIRVLSETED